MKNEPAVTTASVLAVLVALLGLLRVFGVDITAEQQTAIVTFAGAVGAIVVGFVVRSKVTPVSKL